MMRITAMGEIKGTFTIVNYDKSFSVDSISVFSTILIEQFCNLELVANCFENQKNEG